jgi:hypothetical protein
VASTVIDRAGRSLSEGGGSSVIQTHPIFDSFDSGLKLAGERTD